LGEPLFHIFSFGIFGRGRYPAKKDVERHVKIICPAAKNGVEYRLLFLQMRVKCPVGGIFQLFFEACKIKFVDYRLINSLSEPIFRHLIKPYNASNLPLRDLM